MVIKKAHLIIGLVALLFTTGFQVGLGIARYDLENRVSKIEGLDGKMSELTIKLAELKVEIANFRRELDNQYASRKR